MVERIRIDVTPSEHVTAIAYSAAARDHAGISLILAHGAGANQTSSFMVLFRHRPRGAGNQYCHFHVRLQR
jgi:predicted alpha/beta-hydrolase family hydrolase